LPLRIEVDTVYAPARYRLQHVTSARLATLLTIVAGLFSVRYGRSHPVLAVHEALYTTLMLLSLGLTVWALFFIATGRAVDGAFRSTYVLTIGASVIQALVGLLMYLDGYRPGQVFHYLYGISLIVFTGAGYAFATRGDGRREPLIFGIASAAAFGLILRAVATAH
jgi:hypothetical protein